MGNMPSLPLSPREGNVCLCPRAVLPLDRERGALNCSKPHTTVSISLVRCGVSGGKVKNDYRCMCAIFAWLANTITRQRPTGRCRAVIARSGLAQAMLLVAKHPNKACATLKGSDEITDAA